MYTLAINRGGSLVPRRSVPGNEATEVAEACKWSVYLGGGGGGGGGGGVLCRYVYIMASSERTEKL